MKKLLIGLALLGSISSFASSNCNLKITGWTTGGVGSVVRTSVETSMEQKGYDQVLNGESYGLYYETFDSSPDLGEARIFSKVVMTNSNGQELLNKQILGSGIVFFNKPKGAIEETTSDAIKLIPTCEKLKKLENL